ncbi:hypothetical protein [Zhihengliuella sp.]|uniref:hypothetical protein n=1 Tax=Zhihengliuella sp. TaxID=1954483 RepID=UPI0028128A8F|nr:hypothetical protein [Zhihengliuella sp.]
MVEPSNPVNPSNVAAIEKASGCSWADWVALLDEAGAREEPHPRIAELAHERLDVANGNNGWWAQSIAVAYEQHIGRRLPGQRADGTFDASVSRTVAGRRDGVAQRWADLAAGRLADAGSIAGAGPEGEPRTSATDKRSYWRLDLDDGTRVAVSFEERGEDRVLVTATHTRVPAPDGVAVRKAIWKDLLGAL